MSYSTMVVIFRGLTFIPQLNFTCEAIGNEGGICFGEGVLTLVILTLRFLG